ncbi:1-acyl-sn-glycerol-3-phosphate acyltransferase [Burkholderia sp. L27(2015)]|uniref:lysophospholipid acyltransferase family protein n=1 Tax=Burkholderia sp. L27(2015) TaxID=1641858 RepID=UPI00131D32C9|nr:lysophospholipid acyltransferase family protein [Burkholderia sp. L27(2015)]
MKHPLRKLRLLLHIFRGVLMAALMYPRATPERQQMLIRDWSQCMLKLCGITLVVHSNGETLERGAMVVGNHISWIDIYVIDAWRPTPFVSKAEIADWPVIGWLAKTIGTVFIQRGKRSDAKKIMHQLADILRGGGLITVFPEGTTTDGLAVQPFHTNLFQAAVYAEAPIQPICLMYEDATGRQSLAPAYIGDTSLAESLDMILSASPLTAHLYVGEALAAGEDRRVLAQDTQEAVQAGLDHLRDKTRRRRVLSTVVQ